jgi:hypothetical protein
MQAMAHGLIIGQTESGKTTWAKQLARRVSGDGFGVLVLDPLEDPQWVEIAHFVTSDVYLFLKTAKASRKCFLIVDEAAENCGHRDYHSQWCATRSRHWGHSAFFISQRYTQISPTIRNQCRYLIMFNTSAIDSAEMAKEFGKKELLDGPTLPQFVFYQTSRFGSIYKGKIEFA